MSNPAAIAKLARLAVGASNGNASSAATQRLFFTSFTPGCKREMIDIGENVGGFGDLGHGMPSWSNLPEAQRWQLVAYLRSIQ